MNLISKTIIAITSTLLLSSAVIAQDKPIAGTVAQNSLKGKTLTFAGYGGLQQEAQEAALKGFAETSGARLLFDGPVEIAKIQAQVNSGNIHWDVVSTADLMPWVYCGKLFQKLDYSKIDTSKHTGEVYPCGVPGNNYASLLMYKNSSYPNNPPKNWQDFFDTENFPGTRAIDGTGEPSGMLIEQAIIAAGGSVKNMTVADIDLGINKIRELGIDTIFWKTGNEAQQLVEAGEVDMLMIWGGRAMSATRNGADYTPVWQDWFMGMDQLVIPIGAKDPDASHALINYWLGRKPNEIYTQIMGHTPVNKDATPKVDEMTAAFMMTSEERQRQRYHWNTAFWVEHFEVAAEKWAELLVGY